VTAATAREVPLALLTEGLGELRTAAPGDRALPIQGIALDSQAVEPGTLFVARRGLRLDGHAFIPEAVARGAAALVIEAGSAVPAGSLPVLVVEESDVALAYLAARFYGHPSHELLLVGVTGTNGKTTTSHLAAAALGAGGHRAAVFGTLGYGSPGELVKTEHTTPPATEFQRILRSLREGGVDAVAVEVSSHALKSHRTLGTRFKAAVFTNLTRDHLDFHRSADDYRESKLRLFDRAARGDSEPLLAVVNLDDPSAGHFVERARRSGDRLLTVSERGPADVSVRRSVFSPAGTELQVAYPGGETAIELKLPGWYNVMNALSAFAAAIGLGVVPATAARGLGQVARVPGRLERVPESGDIAVFVDFAHTPDALATVLTTLRQVSRGRLIAVFGCGGDRDRGKRPLMAEVSTRLADLTLLTSDNPRSESPEAILAEMESGVVPGRSCEVIVDRRAAISRAIELARPGDLVLIAGKGHETVQWIGDRRLPFDDREEARRALRARRAP
jgi:UDP-N-acetylmuramoyl-L-alanyl-D-glutamate--2,6-diaminopimelate ligase